MRQCSGALAGRAQRGGGCGAQTPLATKAPEHRRTTKAGALSTRLRWMTRFLRFVPPLVPKLQLGNALVCEAPLRRRGQTVGAPSRCQPEEVELPRQVRDQAPASSVRQGVCSGDRDRRWSGEEAAGGDGSHLVSRPARGTGPSCAPACCRTPFPPVQEVLRRAARRASMRSASLRKPASSSSSVAIPIG